MRIRDRFLRHPQSLDSVCLLAGYCQTLGNLCEFFVKVARGPEIRMYLLIVMYYYLFHWNWMAIIIGFLALASWWPRCAFAPESPTARQLFNFHRYHCPHSALLNRHQLRRHLSFSIHRRSLQGKSYHLRRDFSSPS